MTKNNWILNAGHGECDLDLADIIIGPVCINLGLKKRGMIIIKLEMHWN